MTLFTAVWVHLDIRQTSATAHQFCRSGPYCIYKTNFRTSSSRPGGWTFELQEKLIYPNYPLTCVTRIFLVWRKAPVTNIKNRFIKSRQSTKPNGLPEEKHDNRPPEKAQSKGQHHPNRRSTVRLYESSTLTVTRNPMDNQRQDQIPTKPSWKTVKRESIHNLVELHKHPYTLLSGPTSVWLVQWNTHRPSQEITRPCNSLTTTPLLPSCDMLGNTKYQFSDCPGFSSTQIATECEVSPLS